MESSVWFICLRCFGAGNSEVGLRVAWLEVAHSTHRVHIESLVSMEDTNDASMSVSRSISLCLASDSSMMSLLVDLY